MDEAQCEGCRDNVNAKTLMDRLQAVAGTAPGPDPWAHRQRGMRCATCMWFVKKKRQGLVKFAEVPATIGRCRRHAPTMNGYPVVFGTDWCGDHKLDENAA